MTAFWVWAAFALAMALVLTIRHYRREIDDFSRELSGTLDDMLAGRAVEFQVAEESLRGKLHVKLKRLYEILLERTERSQKDREQMQSLVSDISHQVRTPVANLQLYHQILSERSLSGEQRREFLGRCSAQVDKLDFLMQSLVKLSRLENGILTFSPERVPVQELLAQGLGQVMMEAQRKRLTLTVDCPEEIWAVCDRKWTGEALFNLLDNAVKYTPEEGHITVSAAAYTFYTVVSIQDDGPGIPEAEQPLIFGRFYRSETAKDKEGVGIGLFLSRKIVSEQGGYLLVKSEPGSGARFMVHLKRQ